LQKLASQSLPGDEAGMRREFLDTIAQLDRQTLQQRIDELQAKQSSDGLDDADKSELRGLLLARIAG
jgi:DNA primase